jgi:transcriptional regulator with XRE-family HTH domain
MPSDIAAEIETLHQMTTGELAERYEELHGQPSRTRHRAYLIRKIAWRIQANAEGDLTERARKRAAELADDADIRVMAPKTMICPPQPTEQTTVNRMLPNGEHNDPRIAKGHSLRKFAKMVGVSPTYLSQVEQGKVDRPPTAERVRAIAEALGENPDQWIALAGRMPDDLPDIIKSEPEAMPALLRAAKGLSAEELRRLTKKLQKKLDEEGKE